MKNKFRPILFSTAMVKAILDGSKTMTRRQLPDWCSDFAFTKIVRDPELLDPKALALGEIKPKTIKGLFASFDEGEEHCPCKYDVGDILWVKETFFMPKSACRIFLKITDIGVERLQDISEEDAIAEGILIDEEGMECYDYQDKVFRGCPQDSFQSLWQSINGNWEENPFVWVISFEKSDQHF